jgi:hypothetical protein
MERMFRLMFPLLFEGDGGSGGGGGDGGGGGSGAGGDGGGNGSGQGSQQKPPWGSDEEFNPEKAWKLIQGLRADNTKVKSERDALHGKVQEHERANETAAEKAQREANEAKAQAATASADALKLRVALDKAPDGMSAKKVAALAKRLSGSTKEELEADADELFADFKPGDGDGGNGGGGGKGPGRRPKENLRSGSGGSSDEDDDEMDPMKLAEKVPRH